MIQLTRLNNHPLIVKSDLIKFVEQAPDTVLTLTSGEKLVVLETTNQVLQRIVEFRRAILCGPMTRSDEPQPAAPDSPDEPPRQS